MQQLPMAWMWAVDGEVYGLSIDLETNALRWFVHAGCACDFDDSYATQTPQQFLARGIPGGVADPPAEILAEIRGAVESLPALPI